MQKKMLLAAFAAMLLPSILWATTYPVLVAKVPFKFSMGKHVFRPGEYHFAVIGVGLLAVLDSHKHVLAVFLTRSPEAPSAAKSSQLVFQKDKKVPELSRVLLGDNEQEILGEEPAGHETRTESVSVETPKDPGEAILPRVPR